MSLIIVIDAEFPDREGSGGHAGTVFLAGGGGTPESRKGGQGAEFSLPTVNRD